MFAPHVRRRSWRDLWPGFAFTRFRTRMTPGHGSAKSFRICFTLSIHHPGTAGNTTTRPGLVFSGDVYYRNGEGTDYTPVTNEWLDDNIRGKGPMGKQYPRFAFIMEGDTPSYLGLIDNGLASWWDPGWGGWGGRYIFRQPYGARHAIWTQGGDLFGRVTSQDTVAGADGKSHTSDQATVWRWRKAFQHDFAARMDWTIKPFSEANHNPVAVVNGQAGTAPIFVDAVVGQPVGLDASQSRDPDGQTLHYEWFHYAEAGFRERRGLAAVNIEGKTKAESGSSPLLQPAVPGGFKWQAQNVLPRALPTLFWR